MAPPIEDGGGVFNGGTAGLLNCPDVCLLRGACWWAGGGCKAAASVEFDDGEAADDERRAEGAPPEAAAIFAISVSQSLAATNRKEKKSNQFSKK